MSNEKTGGIASSDSINSKVKSAAAVTNFTVDALSEGPNTVEKINTNLLEQSAEASASRGKSDSDQVAV